MFHLANLGKIERYVEMACVLQVRVELAIGCYGISCLPEKYERKCVCQTITKHLASRMCYFSKNDLQKQSSRLNLFDCLTYFSNAMDVNVLCKCERLHNK